MSICYKWILARLCQSVPNQQDRHEACAIEHCECARKTVVSSIVKFDLGSGSGSGFHAGIEAGRIATVTQHVMAKLAGLQNAEGRAAILI